MPGAVVLRAFFLVLILPVAVVAQVPDPSIGRNLPGAVPQSAPAEFPQEASALEELTPPEPARVVGLSGQSTLRQVVFVAEPGEGVDLPGVVSPGNVRLLGASEKFLGRVERDFVNRPMTSEVVNAITAATLDWYFANERPIVFVQPLEADYARGRLVVLVVEAVLGEKRATGARWFRNDVIAYSFRMKPGDPINRRRLLNDQAWVNQNPFRRTDVVLEAGAVPGTTDLLLQTEDRFPVRVFGAVDNTGDQQTGEWRWTVGANWGDVFFLGHQLNYQFSAPFANLSAQPVHAMSYIAPLPWHHRFAIFGYYSTSQLDLSGAVGAEDLDYSGSQWAISPRYTIPIGPLTGPIQQEFTFGMDWKSSDLAFTQFGEEVPANQTDVVQFVFGYAASVRDEFLGGGVTSASIDIYWSPGGIGSRNTTSAFQEVDPRLNASYVYGIAQLSRTQRLPWDFSLIGRVSGQFSSGPLPSSEQLAIGGYGTVRGYEERVLFGDQGVVITLEVRTPSVRPLGWMFRGDDKGGGAPWFVRDDLHFLAFWDFGLVATGDPLPEEKSSYFLTSLGVGVRYSISSIASVRCDVGFPLVDPDLGFSVGPRASVGLVVGF